MAALCHRHSRRSIFSGHDVYLSIYLLLDQHVMYINQQNNCYLNATAQMMFNCKCIKDFASSITDAGDHVIEKGQLCYTCESRYFFYRTPTPSSPILCTWNSSEFLNEFDKKHELGEYGELSEIITYSFRAIVRDTKKYHKWLVPKLNILMQMSWHCQD